MMQWKYRGFGGSKDTCMFLLFKNLFALMLFYCNQDFLFAIKYYLFSQNEYIELNVSENKIYWIFICFKEMCLQVIFEILWRFYRIYFFHKIDWLTIPPIPITNSFQCRRSTRFFWELSNISLVSSITYIWSAIENLTCKMKRLN